MNTTEVSLLTAIIIAAVCVLVAVCFGGEG